MAQPRFFIRPGSPDLARLVQDRLQKVQEGFPALCPSTLHELQVVADKLSAIAEVCQAVTKRLEADGSRQDAAAAFKQIKQALEWTEFLEEATISPLPTQRLLLFRAHRQTARDEPGLYSSPTTEVVLNEHYKNGKTVDEFLIAFGRHLGKTELEKQTSRRSTPNFTSTSSRLEWTLHLTERKSQERSEQAAAGPVSFVVFDFQALNAAPDINVFRVSDILDYLDKSGKSDLIPQRYQQWARNCDEYILMGRGVEKAVVQVVPWSELRWIPIINDQFRKAYTLKIYEHFRDNTVDRQVETELGEVCKTVVGSAISIAGRKADDVELVQLMVELITAPGMWFWGIRTTISDADIRNGCDAILQDRLAVKMDQLCL